MKCTSFRTGRPGPAGDWNALSGLSGASPTSWRRCARWPAWLPRIGASAQRLGASDRAEQPDRRLRADRARRAHARAPALRHRQRRWSATARSAVTEEAARRHAVRHAAAFQQGHRRRRSRACCWSRRCPGHFATLLRDTVRTMLPDHDVYITDWHNARDVPLAARPLRLRRIHRPPHPASSRRSAPARTWSRCASPASRRWRPPRVMAQSDNPAQPR